MRDGTTVRFRNLDYAIPHDLRSDALDAKKRPLFGTRIVFGVGEATFTAPKPGTYGFHCTLHPPRPDGTGMHGVLEVVQ